MDISEKYIDMVSFKMSEKGSLLILKTAIPTAFRIKELEAKISVIEDLLALNTPAMTLGIEARLESIKNNLQSQLEKLKMDNNL